MAPFPDRGDLERFRSYLIILARVGLDPRLRSKLDSSDVAQETLTRAVENWEQLKGQTEKELQGWLRAILANVLLEKARTFLIGEKRNVGREWSLEENLEKSSARLEQFLEADQSSPSDRAQRQEQLLQVTEALAQLPEGQSGVVELHYLKGWTVPRIAEELHLTRAQVAGRLRGGLERLRAILKDSGP